MRHTRLTALPTAQAFHVPYQKYPPSLAPSSRLIFLRAAQRCSSSRPGAIKHNAGRRLIAASTARPPHRDRQQNNGKFSVKTDGTMSIALALSELDRWRLALAMRVSHSH